MKILFVANRRWYANVVKDLRKRNCVHAVFIAPRWKRTNGDYHIPKLFGRHIGYKVLSFIIVNYLLLTKRYDVCVTDCVSGFLPLFSLLLSHFRLIPKTTFVHDLRTIPVDYPNHLAKKIEHRFFLQLLFVNRLYDGITVITEEMRKYIGQRYLHLNKPVGIWESGTELNRFKPFPKSIELKRRLGFNDDDFICFNHGDLTDRRGIIELVESFSIIKSNEPKIRLLLLGQGNALEQIIRVIDDMGLSNCVKTHGWVDLTYVPEFISIADLCVIPLPDIDWWRVSSPAKLMEYIASGKNILLTDMAAHTNVVGNESKYFFLPKINPEILAEKILEAYSFYASDPVLFQERGLTERNRLSAEISWETRSQELETFLIRLISGQ